MAILVVDVKHLDFRLLTNLGMIVGALLKLGRKQAG